MKITRRQLRKLITETVADQFIASLPDSGNSDNYQSNLDSKAKPLGFPDFVDFDDENPMNLKFDLGTDDEIISALDPKVSLFELISYNDEELENIKKAVAELINAIGYATSKGLVFRSDDAQNVLSIIGFLKIDKLFSKEKIKPEDLLNQFKALGELIFFTNNKTRGGKMGRIVNYLVPHFKKISAELRNKGYKL